jgi:hypothetical protein
MSVSFVLTGHTPQYLKKIRSDLHETFSVCEDWFPKLIINVCWHACMCVHAQHVETCTQLRAVKKNFEFQLNEVGSLWNLTRSSSRYQGYTKKKKFNQYVHARMRNIYKCAYTFEYLVIACKQCKFWEWWRKWKWVRSVQSILNAPKKFRAIHACTHVHAYFNIW